MNAQRDPFSYAAEVRQRKEQACDCKRCVHADQLETVLLITSRWTETKPERVQ